MIYEGGDESSVITYAILIFPEFPMMAFSSIVEPLRAANRLSDRPRYRWLIVGPTLDAITASNGVAFAPDHGARDAPIADRVMVCSGGDADRIVAVEPLNWIRKCLRSGSHLGAVADGAFLLARAGLLDGYACTLHWTSQPAFAEAFPDIELKRDLYVLDRSRFTSAGGVGSLDMMLELIGGDCGPALAADVAEWFVHSPLRFAVDRRMMPLRLRTGIRDELVLAAVAVMEDAVENRLGMAALAAALEVSPDKLERAFNKAVGISPSGYYKRLRLRRAHDLLAHSTLAVRDVALACGYESMSSFARAFRAQFGRSPRKARSA